MLDIERAYNDFDILVIWNLTEQVVVGRGAISVYSLVTRFLKHIQTGAYRGFHMMRNFFHLLCNDFHLK